MGKVPDRGVVATAAHVEAALPDQPRPAGATLGLGEMGGFDGSW
jgi:hypothetical protein